MTLDLQVETDRDDLVVREKERYILGKINGGNLKEGTIVKYFYPFLNGSL